MGCISPDGGALELTVGWADQHSMRTGIGYQLSAIGCQLSAPRTLLQQTAAQ